MGSEMCIRDRPRYNVPSLPGADRVHCTRAPRYNAGGARFDCHDCSLSHSEQLLFSCLYSESLDKNYEYLPIVNRVGVSVAIDFKECFPASPANLFNFYTFSSLCPTIPLRCTSSTWSLLRLRLHYNFFTSTSCTTWYLFLLLLPTTSSDTM